MSPTACTKKLASTLNERIIEQCGSDPFFKIEPIPGKGLGLVACKSIKVGKEILREDAVLKTCMSMLTKEAEFSMLSLLFTSGTYIGSTMV